MKLKNLGLIVLLLISVTVFSAWRSRSVSIKSGQQAPDITFTGPSGDTLSLSKLHGKIVLLDFWASWCGPCRQNNAKLVKIYERYSKKEFQDGSGFTIFSVSLDDDKQSWQSAIQKDELKWPYHVCDFGGWHSAIAAKYGVNAIPAAYLIDERGEILSVNPSRNEIEFYLKKRLK